MNEPATAQSFAIDKVFYEIRPIKDMEKSPASFARALLALTQLAKPSFIARLKGEIENISFEIAALNSVVHFYAIVPVRMATYFESQILAAYPKAGLSRLEGDYLAGVDVLAAVVKELVLTAAYYFPLRTHKSEKDIDPLASVLGALSKATADDVLVFQINLAHGGGWQNAGRSLIAKGVQSLDSEGKVKSSPHPHAAIIEEKISQNGFETSMRLFSYSPDPTMAASNLANLASSFGSFSLGTGNGLKINKPLFFFKDNLFRGFIHRTFIPSKGNQYLNVDEIATLFHLPDISTSLIKNIAWGGMSFNDPPQDLPAATDLAEEERQRVNFFAKTEFKNQPTIFGIKDGEDRRRHFYIIGKTGTGKSTLIANMAISDIRKGNGVAIIDPHGDLSDIIMNYIPPERINDVAYLDPSMTDRSFHVNPFEVADQSQGDIVTSNFVSIFHKLYSFSWGPRLEYILRNTVLTLVKRPGSTILDIPRILTDPPFRRETVAMIADPVLRNFWTSEYDKYAENFRQEAISPILNKIGQFISSTKMRNIIGYPKSTIDLGDVMNQGKIMILNLSQGKIGEDNAALLGALFITKFQLAATARAHIPEKDRRDFYLYVDEFQNFATESFIKILSEARKYRLSLILANQYMAQLSEEIQKAILGNVGSIVSFVVGAADAAVLNLEFGKSIPPEELVALDKYKIALKLSIGSATSSPFTAHTLPLPETSGVEKSKVLAVSSEHYTTPVEEIPAVPTMSVVQSAPSQPTGNPNFIHAQGDRPPARNFEPRSAPMGPRNQSPQQNMAPRPTSQYPPSPTQYPNPRPRPLGPVSPARPVSPAPTFRPGSQPASSAPVRRTPVSSSSDSTNT